MVDPESSLLTSLRDWMEVETDPLSLCASDATSWVSLAAASDIAWSWSRRCSRSCEMSPSTVICVPMLEVAWSRRLMLSASVSCRVRSESRTWVSVAL